VKPGSLLLAEACQKPNEVVKYMGNGDECHAAYHFPLMAMLFKAIAMGDGRPVKHTLSPEVTPHIPEGSQWLSFLRVHDELSLELIYVSEEDRKFIHDNYCHKPEWDFRVGEGISARLSELMQRDERKIALAYSLMLTLTGTPVVYYGDEFGKWNDEHYYAEQIKLTGKDDTRFLVRGRIDWEKLQENLKDEDNFHARVFELIIGMLNTRKDEKTFGRGETEFITMQTTGGAATEKVLAYIRKFEGDELLLINNLSDEPVNLKNPYPDKDLMLLFPQGFSVDDADSSFRFDPFGFVWLRMIK
jgi:maltose alpha-D-glucosyltransferase/alpha-amylase